MPSAASSATRSGPGAGLELKAGNFAGQAIGPARSGSPAGALRASRRSRAALHRAGGSSSARTSRSGAWIPRASCARSSRRTRSRTTCRPSSRGDLARRRGWHRHARPRQRHRAHHRPVLMIHLARRRDTRNLGRAIAAACRRATSCSSPARSGQEDLPRPRHPCRAGRPLVGRDREPTFTLVQEYDTPHGTLLHRRPLSAPATTRTRRSCATRCAASASPSDAMMAASSSWSGESLQRELGPSDLEVRLAIEKTASEERRVANLDGRLRTQSATTPTHQSGIAAR